MCKIVRQKAGCADVHCQNNEVFEQTNKQTNWLSSSSVLSAQLSLLLMLFKPDGGADI